MLTKLKWGGVITVLLLYTTSISASGPTTFSMPDSVLLFGTYDELRIVTPDHAETINPPTEVPINHGYLGSPSISPRGDLVAWGFAREWRRDRSEHAVRFTLGVFSLAEHKWKTFGDFDDIGNPVFSPDGSKIVFPAAQQNKSDLLIFDVANEVMTKAPYLNGIPQKHGFLRSWSPDGKQFAMELIRGEKTLVGVLDIDTSNTRSLGEGFHPTWSPNGEWIAYFDPSGAKCFVQHPDGTGIRVLKKLRQSTFSYRRFGWGSPIWSPDSKQILVDEMKGDGDFGDTVLLNVESGRETTKARNSLPIYGWATRRVTPTR